MTLPVRRQQQPPQIGMIDKTNAKQIEYFAFHPIRRRPHSSHAFHSSSFACCHLQTYTFVTGNGIQVIDDLKRCFLLIRKVYTCKIRKKVERRLLISFEIVANFDNSLMLDSY